MNRLPFGVRSALLVGLLALLPLLAGCRTTYPAATDQLATARAALASAEEAGAREAAPLPLRNARQKLEEAREADGRRDNLRARLLAEQAAVDARLAEVTARAQRQQEAVEAIRASNDALRQEIERNRGAAGGSR